MDNLTELAEVGERCAAINVRKASRAVTRLYASALADVGLEPTQFALLVACARQASATIGELAVRVGVERSALSRAFQPMMKRGLLETRTLADQRAQRIAITLQGRDLLAHALPRWRSVQSRLESAYGTEQLGKLVADLRDLTTASSRTESLS